MEIKLYPHNQKTYEKMTEMFETNNRVGVVQPTGTGKSFLYLKWIEDHLEDTFAILSPSTEIFTQLQEYAESSGFPDLLDSVQMISYQALLRMTDEEVQSVHTDKMVLDEFHRTGAEQWGPSLQRLLDANPNAQVLGASATPVRYLDDSKDMASELFDRNLAVEMTLGEAVRRNILPTPKYIPVWYDIDGKLEQYERDISKGRKTEERKELEEKLALLKRRLENSYGAEDIFAKNMLHDHGKFIVFCRDTAHLEEMQKKIPQWLSKVNGNVHSYVSISAEADKDLQLQAFKDDKSEDAVKLLFTIDRLNEGVHVKGIDGVMMLRPTVSPIIYLQQMGRALASGGKVPLIFDLVNNYQNVQVPVPDGETRNVFEFEFRRGIGSDMDVGDFKIFEDMMNFTAMFEKLEDSLYLSYDQKWGKWFSLLEKFVEEYERFPKKNEIYEGFYLGRWCWKQKLLSKNPTYPGERFKKLKDIGLWDHTWDQKWEKRFKLLEKFVEEYERFPKKDEIYEGFNLGAWCHVQKEQSKASSFPPERLGKLKIIGLLDNTFDKKWEGVFALLEKFVGEYSRFPYDEEVYEGFDLGAWCRRQKVRAKKPNYPIERYKKLKSIGLLDATRNNHWEQMFSLLEKFVIEHQRLPKRKEVYEDVNLGRWCGTQIQYAKKPNYPPERRKKLEAIGLLR